MSGSVHPNLIAAVEAEIGRRNATKDGRETRFTCPNPAGHRNGDAKPSCRWNHEKAVFSCLVCGIKGGTVKLAGLLGIDATRYPRNGAPPPAPSRTRKAKPPVLHATREACVAACVPSSGKLAGAFTYRAADESRAFEILRINLPTTDGSGKPKKTFRAMHKTPRGWLAEKPKGALPLYNLPVIIAAVAKRETVFLVEGERKTDELAKLGLPATTSAFGAKNAKGTDWTPLSGANVVALPDNDMAGEGYIGDAAQILAGLVPRAGVRVLRLPDLSEAGDIIDWLALRDATDAEDIRAQLLRLVETSAVDWAPGEETEEKGNGREPEHSETTRPLVSLVNPNAVAIENVRWLWPGYLSRGHASLIGGRYGSGKSTAAVDLAARVIRGDAYPLGGGIFEAGRVLYIHPDEPASDVRRRFHLAGIDDDAVEQGLRFLTNSPNNPVLKLKGPEGGGLKWLRDALRQWPADLVVIDTLGDLDLEGQLQQPGPGKVATAELASVAAEYGCCILALVHAKKGKGHNRHDAPYGAASTFGSFRSCYVIRQKEAEDPNADEAEAPRDFGVFCLKASHARIMPRPFGFSIATAALDGIEGGIIGAWRADPGFTERQALDAAPHERTQKQRAEAAILESLASGVLSAEDLTAECVAEGFTAGTINRARGILKGRGAILTRTAKSAATKRNRTFWALAAHAAALDDVADTYRAGSTGEDPTL